MTHARPALWAKNSTAMSAWLKKTAGVQELADEVNAKRREEYTKISKANSEPVDVVAKLAAPQIISKLEAGEKYQAADGSWKSR